MARTIKVEIVTQEEQIASVEAKQVSLPAANGEITVLPDHRALTSLMSAGEIIITDLHDQQKVLITSPGFIQVEHNRITVLADSAVREEDLDEEKALAAKQAAEAAMTEVQSQSEIAITEGTIQRSLMEIRAIRRRSRHAVGK